MHRQVQHVRIDLHGQRVLQRDAAAGVERIHRHAVGAVVFQDDARAVGSGLQQRAVDLLGRRAQRQAHQQAAQVRVGQDAAVAVPPVQREQAALSGAQPRRPLGQQRLHGQAARTRLLRHAFGRAGALKPVELVAHAALARLIACIAGQHAVPNGAAHARHGPERLAHDDVTGRRADDRQQLARPVDAGRGHAHVRVDVARRHGNARRQPAARRCRLRQAARAAAQRDDRSARLLLRRARKGRVQPGKERLIRKTARVERLVAQAGGAARLPAGQLPDQEVRRLRVVRHRAVDLRRLLQHLQQLGEEPLRIDQAAVQRQPRLAAPARQFGHAPRLPLRRMVLPHHHVGVRHTPEPRVKAQRHALRIHRQHGAGRAVQPDAHDLRRVGGLRERGEDVKQHVQIVLRVLQRPVGG